jgi:hypothetical protein
MTRRWIPVNGLTIFLLLFEAIVLVMIALFPYGSDPGLATIHATVYSLLAPLSTVFLLGILYAWLVWLGGREASRRSRRFRSLVDFLAEPFRQIVSTIRNIPLSSLTDSLRILSRPRLLLATSMVTSVLLALNPYRPDLNPTGTLVGVDSQVYAGWISRMLALPPAAALQYSFVEGLDGSRPLLLILLYLASSVAASPSLVIELLPLSLAPLLSLSVYIFVRHGQGSPKLAALAALFTPFSFYVTVGMWGAYYANWLGLILVYPFLTCLLIFSKSPSTAKYSVLIALSTAIFLTHPWTWVLIIAACLVFAVSLWRETKSLVHVKSLTGIIAVGVALDIAKSVAFSTRTVAADLVTKTPGVMDSLASFWNGLVDALLNTHGGLLGSWIIMGLAVLGTFSLRFKDWFERLLILWVGVASVPFLVLDSYHKARVVYDLPIPILASLGSLLFVQMIGTKNVRWPGLWTVIFLLLCTAYAVQGMLLL